MSYCKAILKMKPADYAVNKNYHDNHYGFTIDSDDELFCRMVLEINQAGLSWNTILHKEKNFRKAYSNFNVKKVAAYKERDIDRLMKDDGIIRNKLKINAAVHNANVIIAFQQQYGSFKKWIELQSFQKLEDWVKMFKKNFKFMGKEIVNEFLMSTGYIAGAHDNDCAVYKKLQKQNKQQN